MLERRERRYRGRRRTMLRAMGVIGDVEIEGVDHFGRRVPLGSPAPTPRTVRLNAWRGDEEAKVSVEYCCAHGLLSAAQWVVWAHGPGAMFVTRLHGTCKLVHSDATHAFSLAAQGGHGTDSQPHVMRWLWELHRSEGSGVELTLADGDDFLLLFFAATHSGPNSVAALRFLFEELVVKHGVKGVEVTADDNAAFTKAETGGHTAAGKYLWSLRASHGVDVALGDDCSLGRGSAEHVQWVWSLRLEDEGVRAKVERELRSGGMLRTSAPWCDDPAAVQWIWGTMEAEGVFADDGARVAAVEEAANETGMWPDTARAALCVGVARVLGGVRSPASGAHVLSTAKVRELATGAHCVRLMHTVDEAWKARAVAAWRTVVAEREAEEART